MRWTNFQSKCKSKAGLAISNSIFQNKAFAFCTVCLAKDILQWVYSQCNLLNSMLQLHYLQSCLHNYFMIVVKYSRTNIRYKNTNNIFNILISNTTIQIRCYENWYNMPWSQFKDPNFTRHKLYVYDAWNLNLETIHFLHSSS